MTRILFLAAIVSIPVFIFINVYQSYSFYMLQQEVYALEAEQKEYFELNKEALSSIALLKSLDRLEKVAVQTFGLSKLKSSQIIHVRLPNFSGGSND